VIALDVQSKKLLWKYTPKDRQFPSTRRRRSTAASVFVGSSDVG